MPQKGTTNNPQGRPKGIVNRRVQQWESLSDAITGQQAEKFEIYLNELWASEDPKEKHKAAQLFLQTLEYFKPKQSRTMDSPNIISPLIINIPDSI
jgi:hypothetical protein